MVMASKVKLPFAKPKAWARPNRALERMAPQPRSTLAEKGVSGDGKAGGQRQQLALSVELGVRPDLRQHPVAARQQRIVDENDQRRDEQPAQVEPFPIQEADGGTRQQKQGEDAADSHQAVDNPVPLFPQPAVKVCETVPSEMVIGPEIALSKM